MFKKHIALVLFQLGMFIFTFTFQPYHVAWQHSEHDHDQLHLHASENHTDCTHIYAEIDMHKDASCLICDYEFSINDLPVISLSCFIVPVVLCAYINTVTQQLYKQVFTVNSPRAPPIKIALK